MPLTLVLGPANSAKAGEVLGAYGDAARRGAVLVVPTAADARHYALELAGDGVVFGSVLTFAALAGEIARRAGFAGRRLSALQRERVLRRAVGSARLRSLAPSAAGPGFVAAAGELIAELERSLIAPPRFAAALRSWAELDPRRAPYAEELAAVYLAYGRELERLGRLDSELFAWRALDALRAAPGGWGTAPVFFYGFDELTALERDAVETLSRIVGAEVTVSITYEPGREALAARAEGVQELRAIAGRVLELPALDEHYATGSRAPLHHLERGLFEPGAARVAAGHAVRLLEAGGERAEAELVGAEVLELLAAGVPGEEIVIVYRSLARRAPVVERVFGRYGIPLASDYELPLARTALGRGVLGLARCALLDPERARAEDLLAYLRTPGMLERPELADALEVRLRTRGLDSAADARELLGWELAELDSLRGAADPGAELARHARRLLAAPHRGATPTLAADEQLDARALATLLRGLSELAELGDPPRGEELVEWLAALPVPAGAPQRPGAVLLAEPLAIRARRFRAVFVCGLQEGEMPLPGRPEPFLPDERRRELAACSGLRLRPREDSLARERYLFYACASRATEQLVLSYRSSDEEGNLLLPSPFIADVAQLLDEQWPARRRRRLLPDVVWSEPEAPTERERARARAARAGREAAVPEAAPGEPAVLPAERLGAAALAHVRHREIVSAGALESYADCPVKWLVERELQPDRFDPDPDPIARGNVMHDWLEQLLSKLGGPVSPESLPEAHRLLDQLLTGLAGEELSPAADAVAPGRPAAVRAAALRAIEADLRRYLEHEAANGCQCQPVGLELRFGFEEDSLPALELGREPERVRVRGMIDRVDADPEGRAIVRDYKSGRARPEHQGGRWSSDRQLQVALYMLAVRRLLGLEPVAGLYQPLAGEDLRARGLYADGAPVGASVFATDARDAEQLEAELEQAQERAVALASRLRSGELTPCPETCSRDGCAYPGICRVG
ncbi:MAG: PD-(D/E)XK nuclease family protein [Solirubrobacterales bacterium]|nr:PD-(D/E)XK nuclease family protein [Solirubrobacterales bacterium]